MSQGGLALVPLDMWTGPWERFLSHRLNHETDFTPKAWVILSAAGIESKGLLLPHGTCGQVEGRHMKRVSKEVSGQIDPAWQQAGQKRSWLVMLFSSEMSGNVR